MPLAFAILTICCTGIVLSADAKDHQPVRGVAKALASAGFIGVALSRGALDGGPAQWSLLCALSLSAIGDIALIGKSRRAVAAGLGAFFLAHLGFIAVFVLSGVSWIGVGVAAIAIAQTINPVWRWLSPHIGALRYPVTAYVGVILVMVAMAGGALAHEPSWPRVGWLTAALTFMASDLFVARQRFVFKDPINRRIGLPLYYAAQLGFAFWMTTP